MNPIVAHRGWASMAPENTLAAVELALREERIDSIEIDIHSTKDNVLVVTHDFTLDRTSNGIGYISDYTYNELLKLDFGSWFSQDFVDERIPRLEEVLERINGKKNLIIEIKKRGNKSPNIEKQLISILREYKYNDKILVKSFNHEAVKKVHELNKNIKTGLLIYGNLTLLLEQIKYTGASFISINHDYITEKLVNTLLSNNLEIMAWTLNNMNIIKEVKAISDKIHLITDYPQLLIEY